MMTAAEMYISGVSTRQVEKVMQEFGIESLSSTQVSRATKQLDKELEAWRNRPIGVMKYLILDARYEKARKDGVVRDAAVLTAIGIGEDERRHVLGGLREALRSRSALARFPAKPEESGPVWDRVHRPR